MEDLELVILALRVLFVGLLYVFVLVTLLAAWGSMRVRSSESQEEAAGFERGRARLVMVSPGSTGIPVGMELSLAASAVLGRAASSNVALPDATVSARHARLAYREGQWWLEDLGSANGTYVNGKRVDGPTAIADGDELDVAQVRLRLEVG